MIGIDGCHLKGLFGGIRLSAISLEANLGWFPVAYAIVEQRRQLFGNGFLVCCMKLWGGT